MKEDDEFSGEEAAKILNLNILLSSFVITDEDVYSF
jgi:hypothetical protein